MAEKMTPETLRETTRRELAAALRGASYLGPFLNALDTHADAWEECEKEKAALKEALEAKNKAIRSLWHGVVDGDMDRLSVGYALKDLLEKDEP